MKASTEFPNPETRLLFDGDLILYQKGFKHEETPSWGIIQADIDNWIEGILDKFGTRYYIIYLTGKGNFRDGKAVTLPYKGNRTKPKPKWYRQIKDYLLSCHPTELISGMEADDAIAIEMTSNPDSIHVGIDKDIWMVEGWHYRYATHNSPEVPLELVKPHLKLNDKGKLKGGGYCWFYAQMLMGDRTDNIQGVKGYGDKKAYKTLEGCETEAEHYLAVKQVYDEACGDDSEARIRENADLLWMVRELDSNGEPVLWEKPNGI